MSTVSLASVPARADITKAWAAAKASLPADTKAVIGIDITALQKSELFKALIAQMMGSDGRAKLDAMKAACKVDPLTALQGVVIALGDARDDGAAFLALNGVDRTKASACLQVAAANGDKTAKVTITQDGPLTQIGVGTSLKYVGWIGKDVVVIPLKSDDKAAFAKWAGGKGAFAKSSAQKSVGKANTQAAVWFAGDKPTSIDLGMPVTGGYAGVTVGNAKVGVDAHIKMTTASDASTLANGIKTQLEQGKKAAEGQMPSIAAVFSAVTVTQASDEIAIKANVNEPDLAQVIGMAMSLKMSPDGPPPAAPKAPAPAKPAPAAKPVTPPPAKP
jgi:hypothetical protein